MGEIRNLISRGHEGINPENDFINPVTGEIINFNSENEVIKSKSQVARQRANIVSRNNPWSWANMSNIKNLLAENELTLTSLGAILVLASNIGENGYLIKQTKSDEYLTRAEIQKKLRLGDSTFKRLLKELRECGLIIVEGESQKQQIFKINSDYHYIGKVEGKASNLARVQKYGFNRLYEDSSIKLDRIGFLYLLIPYLSYENCTLVKDTSKPADFVNGITIEELMEELNMDKRTIQKYLKTEFNYKLKDGEYRMPIVAFAEKPSSKKKVILVNPVLFRRRKMFFDNVRFDEMEEVFKMVCVKL